MYLENYFSKKEIISNLSKYEMYYQVTLGSLISIPNSKEISYEIEFQLALGSIYELLKELENLKDEELDFENELRKQSAMDAVQNFANENLELIKSGKIQIEEIVDKINDNEFFNETMIKLCEDNLEAQISKWENIISDELANAILQSLKDLEEK